MKAILFDLDGVLYESGRAIPGAREAVEWAKGCGIPHLFVTNTTSSPRRALAGKLGRFGIAVEEARILTPAVAAARWLREHVVGEVALFVIEETLADFADLPEVREDAEHGASAVVIGDLGESWDFATLNRAFRLLMAEPRPVLVALGMTRYWLAEDGMRLDVAPFVAALERAVGIEAVVLGKPAAPFFEMALEILGVRAGEAVMVGDDIRGDVQGAQSAGLRGVLVRTGKFRPGDLEQGIVPDAVLDSVADLPAWWERQAQRAGS